MTVESFGSWWSEHRQRIVDELRSGSYRPQPVKRCEIGFRPGRSAHGAVLQAREFAATGYRWVVDLDLKSFFDQVNHDTLMGRLAKQVEDRDLLRLIRRFLAAGMMEGGVVSPRTAGTLQEECGGTSIVSDLATVSSSLVERAGSAGNSSAVNKELAWLLSTSRGPWRLSRNPQVHQGFGPEFWADLDLINLPKTWRKFASAA